jgi:hypothetical protein
MHDRPFLVGRDPAEHARLLEHVGERVQVFWKLPGVDGVVRTVESDRSGHGRDGAGVVTRDHLERDTLLLEVRERLGRAGAPSP